MLAFASCAMRPKMDCLAIEVSFRHGQRAPSLRLYRTRLSVDRERAGSESAAARAATGAAGATSAASASAATPATAPAARAARAEAAAPAARGSAPAARGTSPAGAAAARPAEDKVAEQRAKHGAVVAGRCAVAAGGLHVRLRASESGLRRARGAQGRVDRADGVVLRSDRGGEESLGFGESRARVLPHASASRRDEGGRLRHSRLGAPDGVRQLTLGTGGALLLLARGGEDAVEFGIGCRE